MQTFLFHFQVDKNSHHSAMESERVIMMIVALFLLVIAIRKVQRFRFLALYFLRKRRHHEITIALLARKIRQQRRRRAAFARRSENRRASSNISHIYSYSVGGSVNKGTVIQNVSQSNKSKGFVRVFTTQKYNYTLDWRS